MRLPLFIARRYLFARKSHNVINVISAISAAGMAIGTAALILILSVYNGFDSLIKQNLGDLDPDLMWVDGGGAAKFVPDSSLADAFAADPRVASVCYTLEDNVFLCYSDKQSIARAKGVDENYEEHGRLASHVYEGTLQLHNELEAELASFLGKEAVCTLPTGFQTNLGIISALVGRNDYVLCDRDNALHFSFVVVVSDGMTN